MSNKRLEEFKEITRKFVVSTTEQFDAQKIPRVTQMSMLFTVMCNISIRCKKTKRDLVILINEMLDAVPADDFDAEGELYEKANPESCAE